MTRLSTVRLMWSHNGGKYTWRPSWDMAAINIYGKPINQISYTSSLSRLKFSELVQKIRFEVVRRSTWLDKHPVLLSQDDNKLLTAETELKRKMQRAQRLSWYTGDWGSITDRQKMYHHHEKKGFTPNEEIFTGWTFLLFLSVGLFPNRTFRRLL